MTVAHGKGLGSRARTLIANKWQGVVNRIVAPLLLTMGRAGKGSWRERQIKILCHTLWRIPANWLEAAPVSNTMAQSNYGQASGKYIQQQNLKGYMHWGVVEGRQAWVSSTDASRVFK